MQQRIKLHCKFGLALPDCSALKKKCFWPYVADYDTYAFSLNLKPYHFQKKIPRHFLRFSDVIGELKRASFQAAHTDLIVLIQARGVEGRSTVQPLRCKKSNKNALPLPNKPTWNIFWNNVVYSIYSLQYWKISLFSTFLFYIVEYSVSSNPWVGDVTRVSRLNCPRNFNYYPVEIKLL